jgi:AcrR family transcriptional regulator
VSATERDATRRRLIEAGTQEFAERGLAGARFDQISLAAGHAKGTIYNYFDSKEELFFTIVEQWCSLLAGAVDRSVPIPARNQLRRIAELDVEIARKDPDLARVVVQHMPALTGTHNAAVAASVSEGLDLLATVIDEGLSSGELTSAHGAATLARLFLGVLSALEMEALLPDPTIHLDDVVELFDHHFLAGLVAA